MSNVYEPAEDSFLMSDLLKEKIPTLLKKNKNLKFLEIGSGSGINLETVFSLGIKKENIFSCDVNTDAVKQCKKLGFNCIVSNLFSNIKEKYDVIVFNPPYLPVDKNEPENSRINTTAGKKGNEIIIRFLKQAKSRLNLQGKIFLITSSLSEKINFKNFGYKSKKIADLKLFFEKLFLWECVKINNS